MGEHYSFGYVDHRKQWARRKPGRIDLLDVLAIVGRIASVVLALCFWVGVIAFVLSAALSPLLTFAAMFGATFVAIRLAIA